MNFENNKYESKPNTNLIMSPSPSKKRPKPLPKPPSLKKYSNLSTVPISTAPVIEKTFSERLIAFSEEFSEKLSRTFHQFSFITIFDNIFSNIKNKINYISKKFSVQPHVYNESFKIIRATWKDKNGNSAEELIERINIVGAMKNICQKEMDYFTKKIHELEVKNHKTPNDIKQIIHLKKHLTELTIKIGKYNSLQYEWANSNYYRDLIRNHNNIKTPFRELIQKYFPIPINMRIHSCTVKAAQGNNTTVEKNELVRLGVVSDMRNGFTNLKELKDIVAYNDTKKLDKVRARIQQRVDKLDLSDKESRNRVVESANYALAQLTDIESVKAAIEERRRFLTEQALPLIVEQARNAGLEKDDVTLLKILDVRLLNHKTNALDPDTGWCHNEANELLDMAEIFKEFSEKKLICDGSGPFLDENGDIHLPQSIQSKDGEHKTVELFAAVINHSVQGYTKNTGATRKVNLESLSRIMIRFPTEDYSDLEKKLMKENTGFMSAINLIDLGLKHNFKTSTGCLSSKDRTGFVCAAWVVLKRMGCFTTEAKRKILRKQLKPKGPAVKVALDNSGTPSLKLTPLLPGVTDHLEGILFRIRSLAKQIKDTWEENRRIHKDLEQKTDDNISKAS